MSPTLDPQLAQASGYHSTQDAQRMQALVRAMLESRRPIALSSPDPDLLSHYSRLLVRDLRQQEHVRIVAHLPGSQDKLVEQLNELLADIPVAESLRRDAAPGRPVHVFVVHDSPTLAAGEFALLVRLVNDLPGANLRIALIQDRDLAVSDGLQTLGPSALHWHIQPGGAALPAEGVVSAQALKQALKEALREAPEALPEWAQPEAAPRRWRWAFWRRQAQRQPATASAEAAATRAPQREPGWAARQPSTQAQAASKTGALARPAGKAAGTSAAKAAGKGAPAPGAKGASKPLAKAVAKTAPKTASRSATPGAKAPASAQAAARRNRAVVVSGVLLSGVLAATLGAWLSTHQPAPRAAQPAGPVMTAAKGLDLLGR